MIKAGWFRLNACVQRRAVAAPGITGEKGSKLYAPDLSEGVYNGLIKMLRQVLAHADKSVSLAVLQRALLSRHFWLLVQLL